jgi:hypothetical protein
MKMTIEMTVAEGRKVIGDAIADKFSTTGMDIVTVEWTTYGSKVTVELEAPDPPEPPTPPRAPKSPTQDTDNL